MRKILNAIYYILKPADTTISNLESNQGISFEPNASGLDIIKSLFWITAAILVSILISSL